MKTKYEVLVCLVVATVALTVAAGVHRLAPGFGLVFKPLLWPLVVLPFAVRPRLATLTAFAVPLVSSGVTGMPALPMALALSAFAATVAALMSVVLLRLKERRVRNVRA